MKLSFARSGGFAGLATSVHGEVTFTDKGASVTSSDGYKRELAAAEANELRANVAKLQTLAVNKDDQHRDAFQYDLELSSDGQLSQKRTLYDDGSPASQTLLNWVRNECDRIWNHRTNQ